MNINWPAVGATILPNIGGIAGGFITRKAIPEWYQALKKPDWRPPNWAFGPVWTYLYSSMGYASYLVWRDGGGFSGPAKLPLIMFGTQLALNWAWTPIFFGQRNIKAAFYEILLLDAAVAATGILFYQVNKVAGYLFIPYGAWLALASVLSYCIYRDNPTAQIKEKMAEETAPKTASDQQVVEEVKT